MLLCNIYIAHSLFSIISVHKIILFGIIIFVFYSFYLIILSSDFVIMITLYLFHLYYYHLLTYLRIERVLLSCSQRILYGYIDLPIFEAVNKLNGNHIRNDDTYINSCIIPRSYPFTGWNVLNPFLVKPTRIDSALLQPPKSLFIISTQVIEQRTPNGGPWPVSGPPDPLCADRENTAICITLTQSRFC